MNINYDKLADEFHSVIAHAAAGTDFDDIKMAVDGCIKEVKKHIPCSECLVFFECADGKIKICTEGKAQ